MDSIVKIWCTISLVISGKLLLSPTNLERLLKSISNSNFSTDIGENWAEVSLPIGHPTRLRCGWVRHSPWLGEDNQIIVFGDI